MSTQARYVPPAHTQRTHTACHHLKHTHTHSHTHSHSHKYTQAHTSTHVHVHSALSLSSSLHLHQAQQNLSVPLKETSGASRPPFGVAKKSAMIEPAGTLKVCFACICVCVVCVYVCVCLRGCVSSPMFLYVGVYHTHSCAAFERHQSSECM
jgi:hypothetical protein